MRAFFILFRRRSYTRYVLIQGWRRKAPTASSVELDVKVLSGCDVLLRSSHTKDSGIKREMSLSMRALSVGPRYAVVVGSLKHCAEGERRLGKHMRKGESCICLVCAANA